MDAFGRFRTTYRNGSLVDASAEEADGTKVAGVADLQKYVAKDPRVQACVVEKYASYAMGRRLSPQEKAITQQISQVIFPGQKSFSEMMTEVMSSGLFSQ